MTAMTRFLPLLLILSAPLAAQAPSDPLVRLSDRARQGAFGNVDALYVMKDGKVLLDERYVRDYREISRGKRAPIGCGWECPDSAWMHEFNYLHPEWHPWFKGGNLHTLQSVTKSVSATLFGIALRRGELRTLDAPLLSFFPRYDLGAVDARLRRASLADLLTMRTGIEWHESDRPLDSTNTTLQLENSRDWMRFTLAQPMDAEPGAKWTYNSGGSALMAEVIRQATGRHADAYAREQLFDPLGITSFHWKKTPTGHPDTEGGLYLAPADLAKIGQLYLDDGVWRGRRLLPEGWARQATARIVANINPANQSSPGYGYQWWRYDRDGAEVWAGNGFGGQLLVVVPQYRVVGVVNSWNAPGLAPPGSTSILNAFVAALLEVGRGQPR
jgi:CubicO group peptidase (beta-lactamase class C family)